MCKRCHNSNIQSDIGNMMSDLVQFCAQSLCEDTCRPVQFCGSCVRTHASQTACIFYLLFIFGIKNYLFMDATLLSSIGQYANSWQTQSIRQIVKDMEHTAIPYKYWCAAAYNWVLLRLQENTNTRPTIC